MIITTLTLLVSLTHNITILWLLLLIIYFVQDGDTALHIACKEGHVNVIESLLSQGADMTIKNNDGNTPLDECQDTRNYEIISLFSKCNPNLGEILNNNYVVLLLVWFVII